MRLFKLLIWANLRIWLVSGLLVGTLIIFGSRPPVSKAANAPAITPTSVIAGGQLGHSRAPNDLKKVAIGASWMLGILQNDTLVSW